MSPQGVSRPQWAPTWNYVTAQFEVEIEFRPQENDAALERLVTHMERGRRAPWTVSRMGDRYGQLARHIVAFRAHVRTTHARFKLGQDESPETRAELLDNLADPVLAQWMLEFNS
jgi:transcriptional regulator